MYSDKKISIIIPAYNVENYIKPCLDSILTQTFKNLEIIIVDDGSSDNTYDICKQYAMTDERIILINQKNNGVSAARNIGIEKSSGEYIFFFDADDFIKPYSIAEIFSLIEENQADTIIYGYNRFKEDTSLEIFPPIFASGMYEGDDIIHSLLPRFIGISYDNINKWLSGDKSGVYVENPALWRTLLSGRIIRENKLRFNESLKVGEDTIFITDYLSCSGRCYVTDKCYYYLILRESSTIAQYEKNALAKLEGKEKLLTARNELTDRIIDRRGTDIKPFWTGTVVMSCIEMAFLLSVKIKGYGFFSRYKLFLRYAAQKDVKTIVKNFKLTQKTKLFSVPFILIKCRLYFLLFICTAVLNKANYKFTRG